MSSRFFILGLFLVSQYGNALSLPKLDQYAQQRELFTLASLDIEQNRNSDADRKIARLKDYPLLPYLQFKRLASGLAQQPLVDINQFIYRYTDLPLARKLRLKALKAKAKKRRWSDVIELYHPDDLITYKCYYLQAKYHQGEQQQVLAQIKDIWLTGHSLPNACDPLLAYWQEAGYKTDSLILQRITLTLANRKLALAKYFAKSLSPPAKKEFNYWLKLYNNAQALSQTHYWDKTGDFASSMLKIAIERLSYQSPTQALRLWPQIKKAQRFSPEVTDSLYNKLALRAIHKKVPQKIALNSLNWALLSESQISRILRALVSQSRWKDIRTVYQQYHQLQSKLAWQYWYGSSLEKHGKTKEANSVYLTLAKQRRYYGFLASDKLSSPYQLNHQTLAVRPEVLAAIKLRPATIRAQELLRLNRNIEARREWYYQLKTLSESERLAAAKLAADWQWHNRAIISLTMTKQLNDLDIRFPQPHLEAFAHEAQFNNIVTSWPLAISRQESAFMTNARSRVGAMGLMQLMPGTASQQAKDSDVSYQSKSQLFIPAFNIKLGTAYLTKMLNKFNHNIAVAAAAYNAGPHRVKRWLTAELPQDQWIETIPFRETREYVKNILAYIVIYQRQLQLPSHLPSSKVSPTIMTKDK
ncbi:MAG: transglycosylase SLT domain-containing protein [Gammaproteobacteria bacterium]|nr:transglycosylase SLT domain-containing protein [Gammaproteobacteria bacterium]